MSGTPLLLHMKRPRVIAAGIVAAFVCAAVAVDLPTNSSQADRVSQATTYVKAIESDSASCRAAMTEAFTLETLVLKQHATAADRSKVPGLLRDDLLACSLTNNDIYDMEANQQAPGFAGGKELGDAANSLYTWETFGANHTIADLEQLLGPPTDLSVSAKLAADERVLVGEAAQAESYLSSAETVLGAKFPGLGLPSPPARVPGAG